MKNDEIHIHGKSEKPVVMIVDDIPKNIQVIANILAIDQYDIVAATDGIEAIDMIREVLPDLILLDIMMPGIDGLEICRRLKTDEATSLIPVVFLTAKAEPEDILSGFKVGAVDYVTKPFSSAELLARVRTHLELKRNRDLISQQNNERRQMLHVLCHDLKNPLTAILATLELQELEPDSEHVANAGEYIRKCCNNCLSVIDQIRRIQALDTRKEVLDMRALNLKYLVRESLEMLHCFFTAKQINVIENTDPEHHVFADNTSMINSVLNNILTNAVKFSNPGTEIHLRSWAENGWVFLSVRDFGIGIPAKILANIYNVHESTSRPGTVGEKGTGFGMPLVKKYIEAYGGDIRIHSPAKGPGNEPESGTEVVMKFKQMTAAT